MFEKSNTSGTSSKVEYPKLIPSAATSIFCWGGSPPPPFHLLPVIIIVPIFYIVSLLLCYFYILQHIGNMLETLLSLYPFDEVELIRH